MSDRFLLRSIREKDATERYLAWMQDQKTLQFIATAKTAKSLKDLKSYIRITKSKPDVIFLAIIDKKNSLHIGNIKYECIDLEIGYAIMGILIGDINYRGKGVAHEVVTASSKWLYDNLQIKKILLGVSKANEEAIEAYKKIGFTVACSDYLKVDSKRAVCMMWDIEF